MKESELNDYGKEELWFNYRKLSLQIYRNDQRSPYRPTKHHCWIFPTEDSVLQLQGI